MKINHWTQDDADIIKQHGIVAMKKPKPVIVLQVMESGTVETDRGVTEIKAGDYIVHDPESGQVWPISADYLTMHYEIMGGVGGA